MQWHPEKKLLACGWQNGGITISNVGTSEVHEHVQGHVSPITTLTWSTRGGHLLTSDKVHVYFVQCSECILVHDAYVIKPIYVRMCVYMS